MALPPPKRNHERSYERNMMCCSSRIGKSEMDGKKLVYEALAVPAIYYNIETYGPIWEYLMM